MVILDFVIMAGILIAYFKCNLLGKKISLAIGGVYSIIAGIVCSLNGKVELLPMYTLVLFICVFFLYRKSKTTPKDTVISLPIGSCSVLGDKENFEIVIIADGKQYKFTAENDKIVAFEANGKRERYGG